ncbi:bifunctional phosphopantothenoylcysteine decarboxylase/phosphopantothenate--cysteine ligase CoaBC [Parabacteroides sp. 52]|uniref:bifunctional phosphopantothenoylcysteine decarboxylase/phosphopantothenate--cysteine ligase CoaBC n=1 Tax=unclassified Parabacteroides TaxID=2649774 RepID=UPI0013D58CC9|nr:MULTISPECIES: bifunctional phosphopantothenoylcysteine decarboxylase/phosphopantothenate--cysteine ligase CoaBC [unclassified Parabacteroides]MDH6533812.1 phosphopantothenoylcysteine decarboxylase/phosphopantothenate--cysteine ligase [Parabacteroides sp. PM5-20]NDV54562.1 bifunctional phosphopantothenoylcysteine decarboxylase/phosphopantothenate--cysteine ligase CoaBC [Parabacteroides sp. 52]
MLKGKKIIVGITGSIAAYKAAYIIRGLVKKGAEVQVVITPSGKEFITPLTLSTLSSHPVISEFFSNRDGSWHSHVDLGLWADAMLIAPATAATIGKMAHGIADNMLVTTYLSCKAPVFVAPAMDLDMFAHTTTQQNLDRLRSFGNHIIEPAEGELASHLVGKGRMEEPDQIIEYLESFFSSCQDLSKKKIVITAGPTYEKIDPVRFIGNYSSGKMGFALAEVCAQRGAEVTLIAGPVSLSTSHPRIKRIDVESAEEMYQATTSVFPAADAAFLCAAVADYRPQQIEEEKIKREVKGEMSLDLVPNKDIAAALGNIKRENQILAGFALETSDGLTHARNKLEKKNLDFIVLNSLEDAGAGFRHDTNKVTIIDNRGEVTIYPLKNKQEVAQDIVNKLVLLFQ